MMITPESISSHSDSRTGNRNLSYRSARERVMAGEDKVMTDVDLVLTPNSIRGVGSLTSIRNFPQDKCHRNSLSFYAIKDTLFQLCA